LIRQIHNPRRGGLIIFVRFDSAVVDRKFSKICKNGKGKFGRPGVAPKLIGRTNVFGKIHGGFFRFNKKFTGSPNTEAIIRSLGGAAHFDGILMDDVLISFSMAGGIVHILAKDFEKGIDELPA